MKEATEVLYDSKKKNDEKIKKNQENSLWSKRRIL